MSQYSGRPLSSSWAAALSQNQWDFTGDSMAVPEWWLRSDRLQRYIDDPDSPFAVSVERFRLDERRIRAIAEIDGLFAGLKILDKAEKDYSDDGASSRHTESTESSAIDPLFRDLGDLLDLDSPHNADSSEYFDLHEPCKMDWPELGFRTDNTGDLGKALIGAAAFRRGMKAEFRRFNDVTSKSTSPAIHRIRSRFQSSEALADCGILVCRDLSESLYYPGTLEEVFAVASASHAMSRILVRQKRMEESQVLAGVRRWRDSIDIMDERSMFDALASEMWPSSCASFTQPEQPASEPQCQPVPPMEPGLDDASNILQGGTPAIGRYHPSRDALDTGETELPATGLEEAVLNLTDHTAEEFRFSQFNHLSGIDPYIPPNTIDPSRLHPPDQHIPGYNPSPFHGPPLQNSLPTSTPPTPNFESSLPRSLSTSASYDDQQPYHFPIIDEVFDCKALNLRNTITFLAVLAFTSTVSDGVYLLSGSGKTATHCRAGSVWASGRSKAERELRREFFDPLKKAGTEDARFLALLAVAKRFVALGSLRTKSEVQDYLIAISKELLTDGGRQAKFIRWIGFGQLPGSTAASNTKPTGPNGPRQQNKRREPPGRQLGEDGLAKKRRGIYPCKYPGCGREYKSPSGRTKHMKTHLSSPEVFFCDKCDYKPTRRDRARQHSLRMHGADLSSSLQETRRGHR